ncbi:DUF1295 domain-containing protein [Candidatus Woesearchaeota archaeon]|nr:DUF1295 domain-containing protein [Candidatus Woesearchaeota archaeon]
MKLPPSPSYVTGLAVYGIALLVLRYGPFYSDFLGEAAQRLLLYLYVVYAIGGVWYYRKARPSSQPLILVQGILQKCCGEKLLPAERTAILFFLVKFFFLPLMVSFLFGHITELYRMFTEQDLSWYPLLLTSLFLLDTLIFAVGYSVESARLGNTIRSVEPTFFGWAVALICYPPFNIFVGQYVPWGANDYVLFGSATTIIRIILISLLVIYISASAALGFKASNLTNRGIVRRFPYSIIRHPAYISKNLIWWITLLPVINVKLALGLLFWTIIYFFRAATEERHLKADPEYREYCQKVKYKFIPGVY